MKFFNPSRLLVVVLVVVVSLPQLQAQGNRDFMRETGKINVVVGVLLLIFAGVVLFLLRLEKKLTKLEHLTKN
jgi:hypothetical protein